MSSPKNESMFNHAFSLHKGKPVCDTSSGESVIMPRVCVDGQNQDRQKRDVHGGHVEHPAMTQNAKLGSILFGSWWCGAGKDPRTSPL